MKYLFLVLLAIVSIIHLVDSYRDDPKRRARTKGFILPLIICYYVVSVTSISWILVGALVTSWLGDVLLIPKGHKWFAAGGISFMLAHFLFIGVYVTQIDFNLVNWLIVFAVALVYFTVAGLIIRAVQPTTPKIMVAPMYIYLIANSLMNVFALMILITNISWGSIVAFIGALLFFTSDCTLFIVRYHKKKDLIFKSHFTVMLAYILGVLLITQGIIMMTA